MRGNKFQYISSFSSILLLALTIFIVGCGGGSSGSGGVLVNGTARNLDGSPLVNEEINFIGAEIKSTTTDSAGAFGVELAELGIYDLTVEIADQSTVISANEAAALELGATLDLILSEDKLEFEIGEPSVKSKTDIMQEDPISHKTGLDNNSTQQNDSPKTGGESKKKKNNNGDTKEPSVFGQTGNTSYIGMIADPIDGPSTINNSVNIPLNIPTPNNSLLTTSDSGFSASGNTGDEDNRAEDEGAIQDGTNSTETTPSNTETTPGTTTQGKDSAPGSKKAGSALS